MQDRARLLRGLPLFKALSDRQITELAAVLKARDLADGGVVFEEGAPGESLFFVASGAVAITKRTAQGQKDLALLGPGDCFGEMAILEPAPRSARAAAKGPAVVLELARPDLEAWTKKGGALASEFFAGLLQVQSQRLRRTSQELTMLYDLSALLLEPWASGRDLLPKVLERLLPHLEGSWSAAACLHNVFNDEVETPARAGAWDFAALIALLSARLPREASWLEGEVFCAPLPGPDGGKPLGFLLFHCGGELDSEERAEHGRALSAAAHLVTSAVVNIRFRTEEKMRGRLASRSHGTIL